MAKKIVMEFIDDKKEEPSYGLSYASVVSDSPNGEIIDVTPEPEPPKKRGPGRPKSGSNANTFTDTTAIVTGRKRKAKNEFEEGYVNTTKMLFGAVAQADNMYANINQELNNFKNNRSYGGRNRMMHISNFMNAQATLINTKVGAIRELNSIRNKINELTLRKMQMDKDIHEENSDKAVMDAYYALINASNYGLPQMQAPLTPASLNTGISMGGTPIASQVINNATPITRPGGATVNATPSDTSFENYKANLTPVQRKMILDNDPNIKTVVVYDQSTGNKYFDVVNVQTGQSIPGVQRPADFLLDNMRIDARNAIAVNSNVNQTFPLVLTGSRVADEL